MIFVVVYIIQSGVFVFYSFTEQTTMQTWSKKLLGYTLAATAGLAVVTSISLAAEDTSIDSIFGSTTSWGFTPSDVITTTGTTSTGVTIQAPVVQANGEDILQYSIVYSEGKSISVAEPQDLFEKKITLESSDVNNGTIELDLDGLKAGTLYYFIIKPTNKDGISGDFSTEGSFTTLGSAQDTTSNNDTTLGAPTDANANFTYVVSGANVTLKWNGSDSVSKYQFSLKNINDADYKLLGSAKGTDGSFSFVVSKAGSYNVKIVGTDANGNTVGSERILNVKVEKISDVPGKGTPQTGPALNIILMSTFLLMLVYVVYKFRGAK